jgi:3-oxoadipate enol-lactonase
MSDHGLHYEIIGGGRNLVLLHSLLSGSDAYRPLIERMKDERRIILLDLPGWGASRATSPAMADFAERVAELMRDLDLGTETDVIGNGLGSFVAMALAARHGGLFDRLVLVGAGIEFPDTGKATFAMMSERAERDGMEPLTRPAMERMFSPSFVPDHPELVARMAEIFRRTDPKVFAAACRTLGGLDFTPELSRIRNKTLIVAGDQDGATPPTLGRVLAAALPDASFVEMKGVGHAPHLEATGDLLAIIAPFLGLRTPAGS